jgi:hypothetical protein
MRSAAEKPEHSQETANPVTKLRLGPALFFLEAVSKEVEWLESA